MTAVIEVNASRPVHCEVCGARFPMPDPMFGAAGYALTAHDCHLCYTCSDVQERADMRASGQAFGYVSGDLYVRDERNRPVATRPSSDPKHPKYITTWSGGPLLTLTYYSLPCRVGFGRRMYVRGLDPMTGERYSGQGPVDTGNYVRLRRVASSRVARRDQQ